MEKINWDKLELREQAAAIALAVGVVALGVVELEEYVETKIEGIFEDGN